MDIDGSGSKGVICYIKFGQHQWLIKLLLTVHTEEVKSLKLDFESQIGIL